LILANVNEMMARFEAKYGKQVPTWSGDFTPYWEDGAYSTAKEEGDVRVLSARLSNLIDAAKILNKPIDRHLLYRAQRSIVMWHEHTWGAWNSISDPDDPEVIAQWKYKKALADSAALYVNRFKESSGLWSEYNSLFEARNNRSSTFKWIVDGLDPNKGHEQEVPIRMEYLRESGQEHIEYTINPLEGRAKYAFHLTFPFNIPNPTVRIGISDTCVTPESGRIPGSNNDFFCAQRWIDVSNDSMGVTIVCPQGALWEVGDMVDERKTVPGKGTNPEYYKAWKTEAKSSSRIYLYALNNYWHTNFKADQEGPITYDIYLKMHGPFKLDDARRFGLEMTRPLITWWK
jgi:hypothetical protein